MISRFLAVGLLNTAVGYAVILLGLRLAAGDYLANFAGYAVGLILAYGLHRRWTFAITTPASLREATHFGIAAILAYAMNLSVIHLARSMGYVDNPLTHAGAMAAYSVTFFVLTRFMVFAGAETGANGEWRLRWAAHYPELALGAAGILACLFLQRIQLMNDVVWQFWIARQMLGGARLYADIWELNPPLWFWSALPVEWLAEQTGIAWQALLIILLAALGVLAAWLVGRLMDSPRQRDRLGLMLLVFAMTTIVPMAGIGQREQLALVTSLPYAALIARRHAGRGTPLMLAAGVGLLGAYGFALKHYFVLVPLALEAWLALHLRRAWRPWRPEVLVLAVLAVAYAASIILFAPEFLTAMVPMIHAAYYAFQASPLFMLVKPYVLFWTLAGGFLLLYRSERRVDTTASMAAFFPALLLAASCFAFSYLIQRRGWDYHSIPATGALAIAVGLHLMRLRRALPITVGGLLLAWLVCNVYPVRHRPESYDPYLNRVPSGEAVFVASSDAGWAWPAPDRRKLIWVSRAYSLWMVPAIAKGESTGPNTPELRHLAAQVVAASSEDIRCRPPMLILIENIPEFSFRDFLFRDPALRQFVADHYIALPSTPRGIAFSRRGPVPPVTGLHCRAIR